MLLGTLFLVATANQDLTEPSFRRGIAENAAYRREQFIAAGLMPIEEVARKRRDVRRLLVSVWLPGSPPVMEIERHRNNSVTLILTWPHKRAARHSLPASVWKKLTALDDAVFARPPYDLSRIGRRPAGVVSCHGDTADFEASVKGRVQTAGAGQCFPRLESFDAAKLSAVAVFVRAAISTRPDCAMGDSAPADALVKCFR